MEPFTYERPTNIPLARADDCGVYTLKYIECHALGIEFSKKDFAKANVKTMRDKMAVDIFEELPDAHEFENKDNDDNLGAYEGRLRVKSSGMVFWKKKPWKTNLKVFWKTKHWKTNLKVFWKKKPWKTNWTIFWTTYLKVVYVISYIVVSYVQFLCILSIYKPCVAFGVCVLSSWIAPTKIAILTSSVFPDHALHPDESMCVPQLVVQHKDIYSLSILQTDNPLSTLDIQVWRYAKPTDVPAAIA
ncbi:hypothetical protein F2Q69_00043867 [Brassica cretica]|uniref:Ubiquitin-like protease family profile domain-containing protein n=1 Tax=Brassica cretica TaxID=69181 RepID=A0A8S9NDW0_BRACR|nr:hypothetical protein F2Q69_00043867 [Brassica cretica]